MRMSRGRPAAVRRRRRRQLRLDVCERVYGSASGWSFDTSLLLLFVRERLSILINGSDVRRLHNV